MPGALPLMPGELADSPGLAGYCAAPRPPSAAGWRPLAEGTCARRADRV